MSQADSEPNTTAGLRLTRKARRYLSEQQPPATKLSRRAAKAIAAIRRQAEGEIERLLTLLDRIDGDPDLEPAGDELDESEGVGEPSLGWQNPYPGSMAVDGSALWPEQVWVRNPGFDQSHLDGVGGSEPDLEGEFDGREDGADDENDRADYEEADNGVADLDALLLIYPGQASLEEAGAP